MDLKATSELVFGLVGGLGIFLLGMKNMSEGMQAVAGNSLRRLISAATTHRIFATIVGTVVTCVVQSSSITTVMVVGFVNSGLMDLAQAIGVIMGANIGTTITGWILVLKIGKYGLPLLGASAFVYLFSRTDRYRYSAMALMGVGMVFFGLLLMKEACAIIREMPDFESWFQQFQASSYLGVLGCAMLGCILTMLVQSSSATLGITISLASQGIISYPTAAALVLGENIGTTITAYLASLGATTVARRAAYFHVIFNLFGVFWITLVFAPYIQLIQWILGSDVAFSKTLNNGNVVFPNVTAAIALTHSIFNVTNTLLFLPFVPRFVRLLERLVPGKPYKEKPRLTDLDIRMLETPLLAIEQSQKEIEKMGDGCSKMLQWITELVEQDERDQKLADRLRHRERVLDSVQDEVSEFITNLLSGNVPHSVAQEGRRQMEIADEFESVSDYIADLEKFDRKLRERGHRFSTERRRAIQELNSLLSDYLAEVNEALRQSDRNVMSRIDPIGRRIREAIRDQRRLHLDDLTSGAIAPVVSVSFLAVLNAYSRVRDHAHDVAVAVADEH